MDVVQNLASRPTRRLVLAVASTLAVAATAQAAGPVDPAKGPETLTPGDGLGTRAVRAALDLGGKDAVLPAIAAGGEHAARMLMVLGIVGDGRAMEIVDTTIRNGAARLDLKIAAVRAKARTDHGAKQLVIRGVDGLDLTLAAKDVENLVKQPVSLMPADLAMTLSAYGLVDLVAWLETLKTPK